MIYLVKNEIRLRRYYSLISSLYNVGVFAFLSSCVMLMFFV